MIPTRLGDFLRVSVYCTSAVTLIITGIVEDTSRLRRGIRQIGPFTYTPSATDATENAQNFPGLVDGNLISVNIRTSTASLQRGQVWVKCSIANQLASTVDSIVLFSEYLSSGAPLGYPGSPIKQSTDGRGYFEAHKVAATAAGNNFSHSLLYSLYRIVSVSGVFTASAVAGMRALTCFLYDGVTDANLLRFPLGVLDASKALYFTASGGLNEKIFIDSSNYFNFITSIPEAYVFKGASQFKIFAQGLDAGDVFGQVVIVTESWITL